MVILRLWFHEKKLRTVSFNKGDIMKKLIALILFVALLLTSCVGNNNNDNNVDSGNSGNSDGSDNIGGTDDSGTQGGGNTNTPVFSGAIGSDGNSYGSDLDDLGAYDGLFEGSSKDVVVKCVSGTSGCYKIEGNTIVFTPISAESVYSISGKFSGNIVINVGNSYKFELELSGFSLTCDSTNPITVFSGDEVSIQAKKNTNNYIYDLRPSIPETDTDSIADAIYSEVDLEISGKGKLFVVSDGNNGIHSKKDLQVKNLDLTVSCQDNALKGNDSVELEAATCTLIATHGDCIKTSNSDISNKGNQRGTVTATGGSYKLYSACDGIDAAYDVVVNDGTDLSIFTDKLSIHTEKSGGATSAKGIKAANKITLNGGNIQIASVDNAIHASKDTALENGQNPRGSISLNGGNLSLYSLAEGLHSDGVIYVKGGRTLVVTTSVGYSAINAVEGYSYTAGQLVAIMPDGESAATATDCTNFDKVGNRASLSLKAGEYLTCTVGQGKLILKLPVTLSACIVMLGSSDASATVSADSQPDLSLGQLVWE